MTDPAQTPAKNGRTPLLWLGGVGLGLLGVYLAGFITFIAYQPTVPLDLNRIDGIVALTGGELRVDTAYRLFERGIGRRLLISGVYPGTSREKLMATLTDPPAAPPSATPQPPTPSGPASKTLKHAVHRAKDLPDQEKQTQSASEKLLEKRLRAIDIGYAAENTLGNAREAAAWARFYHFNTLLVVTARYHMPRSLSEFHEALPGVALIPYPIDPESIPKDWWRRGAASWRAIRLLHGEYAKYLAATLLAHLGLEPTGNGVDTTTK